MSIVLNDETFESLFQETIVELFFANWYQEVLKNTEFCLDSPVYFYRHNLKDNLLVVPNSLSVNTTYQLSSSQLERVYILISLVTKNDDTLKHELIRCIPAWSHFISSDTHSTKTLAGIISPEDVEITDELLSFFSVYSTNFFVQQAYLLVSYKMKNYKLSWKLFQSILKEDPGNPFVLLRYARFLGSACYKQDLNPVFLNTAISYIKTAIIHLGTSVSVFTFCYAWIGQVYNAKGEYSEAIVWYNKTIALNESQGLHKEESYIWVANALTATGEYQKSSDIYEHLFSGNISEKHCLDFRNFKVMSLNYWNLLEFEKFRQSFLTSVMLLLASQDEVPSITIGNSKFPIAHLDITISTSQVLHRDLHAFITYYETYLEDLPVDIRNTILHLGWLYIKYESHVLEVIFHHSRGLEKLCYYYIQTFMYEKKGIGK